MATIEKLTAANKDELLELMVEFYNSPALLHHTKREVLSKVIDDCLQDLPFVKCYVMTDGEKIAAYTIASIGYSTEYGGLSVMIEDLFVSPDYRGKGYGKSLLNYVEERFRGRAVRLRLEVEKNNAGAISLYERCGFREIDYKQMGKLL